jgi:hypothetical protein
MGQNENSDAVFRVAAFVISTALSIGGLLVAGRPHLEPRKTDHRLEVRWDWGWWSRSNPTPVFSGPPAMPHGPRHH